MAAIAMEGKRFEDPLRVQAKRKPTGEPQEAKPKKKKKQLCVVNRSEEGQEEGGRKTARACKIDAIRRYQLEILDKALSTNTIVFLETGCGKTLIAVLLIRKLAHCLRATAGGEKRIAVFLAPTVTLVIQQTEVLSINTDLDVRSYYGAKGVDSWSAEFWHREINLSEVMVMTPQVMLDALRLGLLTIDMVELLIIDECHHAQKQHNYAKIMREFYHAKPSRRPKIFGMTASPVIRKGVSSQADCAKQLHGLETILDSEVYTLKDREELELFAPTPNQKVEYYSKPRVGFSTAVMKLDALCEKACGLVQKRLGGASGARVGKEDKEDDNGEEEEVFRDEEEAAAKLCKKMRMMHGAIVYCLEELGLKCAIVAAEKLLKREDEEGIVEADAAECMDVCGVSKESFLNEAMAILQEALPGGAGDLQENVVEAVKKGLLTPKVQLLVRCLIEYKDQADMRCIVFVERVIAANVLSCLLNQVSHIAPLKSGCLAGMASSLSMMGRKKQQQALELFRTGQVNVLLATDVAEEGLDVQTCSSVIRFDVPKTVRSFIQSRGRARRPGSDFIVLLERNNSKQESMFFDLIRSEEAMMEQALNRTCLVPSPTVDMGEPTEFYRVETTGSVVNMDSSITFMFRYCAKLPGDKYYQPRPEFSFQISEGGHVCTLKLPPNAPLYELIGPPRRSILLAKQATCLEACKKLHAIGQLDDYLLPVTELSKPEDEIVSYTGKKTLHGTTKKKELHSTTLGEQLHGTWIHSPGGVNLKAYSLTFECMQEDEPPYTGFAFLVPAALDEDVASVETELFLHRDRVVKARLSSAGDMYLDPDRLKQAKCFQELLFNGMFSKLVKRNRNVAKVKFLLEAKKTQKLWKDSNMYLVLPLVSDASNEMLQVDWKSIQSGAAAADKLSLYACISSEGQAVEDTQNSDKESIINLASGYQPACAVLGRAVITIHTGKVYSATEIDSDRFSDSAFPEAESAKGTRYGTYANYFKEKYGITLQHPKQPLLCVKQTHRLHNMLARYTEISKASEPVKDDHTIGYVSLPPELCMPTGVPNSIIRSVYLFPSFMHRLNSLLLASQLRRRISKDVVPCAAVPVKHLIESLTTLRCLEPFSSEALELLGDSFLKYATSRFLFLVYDMQHEGQLSARRCKSISNATLCRLADAKGLPGYIRDEPFDTRRWAAPGMRCKQIVECRCDTAANLNRMEEEEENEDDEAEDKNGSNVFKIGKSCDEGHRWMCSKTIADAVEAMIGANYVGGGADTALGFMKWMGMEVIFDEALIRKAMCHSLVHPNIIKSANIEGLEVQLGYRFENKALLVEAITHASQQDSHGGFCYQRLEFLGDAVLDFLVTRHLFYAHPGLTPGFLSDLRSAAVNNECFARAAVKNNLQRYLRHGSGVLLNQITDFARKSQNHLIEGKDTFGWEGIGGPKVLGDLVESIAGAIAIDSGFNLELVWKIMEPLLSPIVTPLTLPLHPIREVQELCQNVGLRFCWKSFEKVGKLTVATAEVKKGEEPSLLTKTVSASCKKAAKKEAAKQLLLELNSKGFEHPRRRMASKELKSELICALRMPDESVSQQANKCARVSSNLCIAQEVLREDLMSEESKCSPMTDDISQEAVTKASTDSTDCHMLEAEDHTSSEVAVETFLMVTEATADDCESASDSKDEGCHSSKNNSAVVAAGGDKMVKLVEKIDEIAAHLKQSSKAASSGLPPSTPEVDESEVRIKRDPSSSATSPHISDSTMNNKEEEITGSAIDFPASSVPITLDQKLAEAAVSTDCNNIDPGVVAKNHPPLKRGFGRTKLTEFCTQKNLGGPMFSAENSNGPPHCPRFTYSVTVHDPQNRVMKEVGQPMGNVKDAKDSAAMKMLLSLTKLE